MRTGFGQLCGHNGPLVANSAGMGAHWRTLSWCMIWSGALGSD